MPTHLKYNYKAMTKEEHTKDFTQWLISSVCISGIDTFFMPDDIETDLTLDQVYNIYLKQKES